MLSGWLLIHPHAMLDVPPQIAMLVVPPLLRNARCSATAAGIYTDLKCGVSEVEKSLKDQTFPLEERTDFAELMYRHTFTDFFSIVYQKTAKSFFFPTVPDL